MLGLISFGYIEYNVSYLELVPQMSCNINGTEYSSCTEEMVCQGTNKPQANYTFVYEDNTSLHNWVAQLDLLCVPGFRLGLLGSMYFAGWASTVLIVPTMADKTGRKFWFVISTFLTFCTMIGFMLSRRLNLTIGLMFLAGAANSGRVMVGFVFGQEFLVPYWQVVFGICFHFIDNATCILTSFYFDFINNQYLYVAAVGAFWGLLAVIISLFFAPESPLWELKMGRVYKAQITLHKMMKMNGVDCSLEIDNLDEKVREINQALQNAPHIEQTEDGAIRESEAYTGRRSVFQATEEEQKSVMFYLRQSVVFKNVCIMAYMWAMCSFCYYMIVFYLKYLPGDIYSNTFASSGTDCLSVVTSGIIYKKLGVRKTFTFLLIFSVIGSLLIIFFGEKNEAFMPFFVVVAKWGISGSFIVVYISMVDIFPTLFLATAFGMCNFLARVLTIVAPQVAELEPPVPMIVFCGLALGGCVMANFVTPLKQQVIDTVK